MPFIYRIGRNPKNDLVLNERTADEFHATLELNESDTLIVSDLNSKYGTVVSDNWIKIHTLHEDDKLQIGFTTIDWPSIKIGLLKAKNNSELHPLFAPEEIHNKPTEATAILDIPEYNEITRAKKEEPISNHKQEVDPTKLAIEPITTVNAADKKIAIDPSLTSSTDFTPKVIVVSSTPASSIAKPESERHDRKLYYLLVLILVGMTLLGWFMGKFIEL